MKVVIFDMNGVIIDDEHIHERAFAQVVKPYGITLSHQAYLELCAGRTDAAGFEQIAKYFHKNLDIDQVLAAKSAAYLQLFPRHKRAYPGVIELIHQLTKQYILALTTSSSRAEAELVLQEFNLTHMFKVVVTADDITQGKPDPEPYLLTASQLGVDSSECVVIEDSKSGVRSAQAAGIRCIAITTTHQEADLAEADVVVDSFAEIGRELL